MISDISWRIYRSKTKQAVYCLPDHENLMWCIYCLKFSGDCAISWCVSQECTKDGSLISSQMFALAHKSRWSGRFRNFICIHDKCKANFMNCPFKKVRGKLWPLSTYLIYVQNNFCTSSTWIYRKKYIPFKSHIAGFHDIWNHNKRDHSHTAKNYSDVVNLV